MTLLFFPKGLEKKAAIAVDLLKNLIFGKWYWDFSAFFILPRNLNGQKTALANRFLTRNGRSNDAKNSSALTCKKNKITIM